MKPTLLSFLSKESIFEQIILLSLLRLKQAQTGSLRLKEKTGKIKDFLRISSTK
uniref:Uncharacterized protein n=1 Tax=Octopus bimaculoides TaxID=37653 RepID=A0A0L8FXL8_OCTBM